MKRKTGNSTPGPPRDKAVPIPYEEALNPQQLEAVQAGAGPLLVIAGAGSGKTRTLIYRMAHLIESGMPPEAILLMTFTNRAARAMLERAGELLRIDGLRLTGGTFHHVANGILRRHAALLGYGANFGILDRRDSLALFESAMAEVAPGARERRFPRADFLLKLLGYAINTQRPLQEILERKAGRFEGGWPAMHQAAARYQARKAELNVMDFDDLLLNWKILLMESPEIREGLGARYQYVLVDEYQDTNRLQGDILDLLVGAHRNIMVVGDDAQSIYAFRGADFENLLTFPARYPGARLCRLETNYRSTPRILELANRSIAHNERQYKKTLDAVRQGGPLPALVPARDVYQQAEFVAQRVLELRDEGVSLKEIAILYRAHYQSMELQVELTRRGLPHGIRSGLRFFEQAHIKDVVAHLKVIHNPLDALSWHRILRLAPGIGKALAGRLGQALLRLNALPDAAALAELGELLPRQARAGFVHLVRSLEEAAHLGQPGEMISALLNAGHDRCLAEAFGDHSTRQEDLEQLAAFAAGFPSLEQFLGELSLLGGLESGQVVQGAGGASALTLSTIHQAKGMEWRAVFVLWLADGRFPAAIALREPGGEEEERRLFYVAVTRASDALYLCYPQLQSTCEARTSLLAPSRFVTELGLKGELPYELWVLDAVRGEAQGAAGVQDTNSEGT